MQTLRGSELYAVIARFELFKVEDNCLLLIIIRQFYCHFAGQFTMPVDLKNQINIEANW